MALSNPESVRPLFHFKSPSLDCITRSRRQSDAHTTLQIEINPPKPWWWRFLIKQSLNHTFKSDSTGQRGLESLSHRWMFHIANLGLDLIRSSEHNNEDVSWRRTNRHGFDDCSFSETCREVRSGNVTISVCVIAAVSPDTYWAQQFSHTLWEHRGFPKVNLQVQLSLFFVI